MDKEIDTEALQRFETIWEHVECGIAIIDAETREILAVNPISARMFGDDISKIIGKRCHKFICPAEQCSCPIMDKGQVVDRSERIFVKADGTSIPIIKSVARIQYKGRLALLESFTDISSIKEAEQKLRAMEIAEQANKAKSDFLSRMSHEMRTPMNAIIGMGKIAETTDDVHRLKHCLSMISASSQHLLGLINDVLDMSKIEANKLELDHAPLNVESMLKKICNMVLGQVEKNKIELIVDIDPDMPRLYIGDELRLSQVITNLMSNAIKFTPEGGTIHLDICSQERKSTTSSLCFTITDTGIGMTEEQTAKLFTAFEQADSSITRRFGGTGLGLAISKNIVKKMNGDIHVHSALGKGSSFIVNVELENSFGGEETTHSTPLYALGVKLLVADASERARMQFTALAERWNIIVDLASDAKSTLALQDAAYKANKPYNLLLIDHNLLESAESDLLEKLSKNQKADTITIMSPLMKWYSIDSEIRSLGIKHFITKPLFPSVIMETIDRVMNSSKQTVNPETISLEMPNLANITLLLAEDVEINREIFATLLAPSKINIVMAENGREAVALFQAAPEAYDFIIMDVQMPEMDGYEATRTIRAMNIPNAASIPIIALTANAFKEDIDKCLACGMNDHLAKPIEESSVIEKICRYSGK